MDGAKASLMRCFSFALFGEKDGGFDGIFKRGV